MVGMMSKDDCYDLCASVLVGMALMDAGVFDEYPKKRRG
jgi:hypothetical protein